MIKYQNEFGETRVKKRGEIIVSQNVLKDLNALKAFPNEPLNSVVERMLRSMDPKEMTKETVKKLKQTGEKRRVGWKKQLKVGNVGFYRRHDVSKALVRKLYEQALQDLDEE